MASPDRARIVQAKPGNHGEGIFFKEYPNPLAKTRSFIHHLRGYFGHIDPRFRRLRMVPVVGFSAQSDISAIHSFEDGMLYVSEILSFVAARRARSRERLRRAGAWTDSRGYPREGPAEPQATATCANRYRAG